MLYRTILCATDGLGHSERAVRRAAVMARETGAELHVVHVGEPAFGALTHGEEYLARTRELDTARVRAQIKEATADGDVVASPHFVTGGDSSVAGHIAALAESVDADLIVVGSHGRGPIAGMLAGSVSQQLPHETHRPVLVLSGTMPRHRAPRRRIRQALHAEPLHA